MRLAERVEGSLLVRPRRGRRTPFRLLLSLVVPVPVDYKSNKFGDCSGVRKGLVPSFFGET